MARYGFTYSAPSASTEASLSSDDANMPRRYGITDKSQAAEFGYHAAVSDDAPPQVPSLSANEYLVLTGSAPRMPVGSALPSVDGKKIPSGGCAGSAMAQLGATIDTALVDRLDTESLDKSQADPKVQAVLRLWSECMKAKGYTVSTPLRAPDLAPSSNEAAPTAEEIAVATADVDCKAKTNLVAVWFTDESAVQQQEIEQNQLALTATRNQITAAVRKAAAVTS